MTWKKWRHKRKKEKRRRWRVYDSRLARSHRVTPTCHQLAWNGSQCFVQQPALGSRLKSCDTADKCVGAIRGGAVTHQIINKKKIQTHPPLRLRTNCWCQTVFPFRKKKIPDQTLAALTGSLRDRLRAKSAWHNNQNQIKMQVWGAIGCSNKLILGKPCLCWVKKPNKCMHSPDFFYRLPVFTVHRGPGCVRNITTQQMEIEFL